MEQDISLKLSVNEINTILLALSKLPYEQVYSLITKVKSQGEEQLIDQSPEKDD